MPHDFAVGLIIPGREEFFPTHVRLLFGLYLKRLSNKEDAEGLFILYYSQLLMAEQDFNYGPDGCKRSNFDPPRGFLMSFIRGVASGDNEIDRIITAAVRNYPPPAKYKRKFLST